MTQDPNTPTAQIPDTYPKGEVDEILKSAFEVLEDLAEENQALVQENESLKQKQAGSDKKVILEKVAFDQDKVKALTSKLVETGLYDHSTAEKIASVVRANPDRLIDVTEQILNAFTPAPTSGRGVEKEASHQTRNSKDPDGWTRVISEGVN